MAPPSVVPPTLLLPLRFGPGETEAVCLALERNAVVILDELVARQTARRLGLTVVGTVGLLVRARESGLIPRLRPLFDALRSPHNFFLSDALYLKLLQEAGEI